ncbi:hypothetical protein Tco_0213486 [Tanacetum coccineum]
MIPSFFLDDRTRDITMVTRNWSYNAFVGKLLDDPLNSFISDGAQSIRCPLLLGLQHQGQSFLESGLEPTLKANDGMVFALGSRVVGVAVVVVVIGSCRPAPISLGHGGQAFLQFIAFWYTRT